MFTCFFKPPPSRYLALLCVIYLASFMSHTCVDLCQFLSPAKRSSMDLCQFLPPAMKSSVDLCWFLSPAKKSSVDLCWFLPPVMKSSVGRGSMSVPVSSNEEFCGSWICVSSCFLIQLFHLPAQKPIQEVVPGGWWCFLEPATAHVTAQTATQPASTQVVRSDR